MEGLSLDLPLLLQTVNDILVSPANLMGQTLDNTFPVIFRLLPESVCLSITYLDSAVLAARLQSQNTECLRHNHALRPVVGRGDTLEELEAFKSSRTTGSLVGNHSADSPVENLGGGAVMEGARLFGVDDVTLVEEVVVPEL